MVCGGVLERLFARMPLAGRPADLERLGSAWSDCLVRYLDQPRAVKRLFTQVDALWPEVDGEVDCEVD